MIKNNLALGLKVALLVLFIGSWSISMPVSATETITQTAMTAEGSAAHLTTGARSGGGIPALSVTMNPDGSEDYSITLQILALMTALGFCLRW